LASLAALRGGAAGQFALRKAIPYYEPRAAQERNAGPPPIARAPPRAAGLRIARFSAAIVAAQLAVADFYLTFYVPVRRYAKDDRLDPRDLRRY
jgi:hypothetical protein